MLDKPREFSTAQIKYGSAMSLTSQEDADQWLDWIVTDNMQHSNNSRITAEKIERANLAYFAGYEDHQTRLRVEELFNCVHPALGPAKNGAPTAEECLKIGMQLGEASKAGKPITLYEQPETRTKPIRKIIWEG
jgi:hypothetical protein